MLRACCFSEHAKVAEWEAAVVYQQTRLDKATLQLAQSHTDNIEGYVKHRTTYAKVCVCVFVLEC